METLERTREPVAHGSGPGDTVGGNVTRTRQLGEDFLSAADDAISRGLSTNSAEFLEKTLQEGGE